MRFRQGAEFRPCYYIPVSVGRFPQPDLTAYFLGCTRGVARNDFHTDTCIKNLVYGIGNIGTYRVGDCNYPEEFEIIANQLAILCRLHPTANLLVCEPEGTHSLGLESLQAAVDGFTAYTTCNSTAQPADYFRSALYKQSTHAVAILHNRRHIFTFG